jgi:hypothetical protein
MAAPPTKTTPTASLETLEWLLDEATEAYREMEQLRVSLLQRKRDSDAYLDLLPEIATSASVVTAKTEQIIKEIDHIIDTMPD